MEKTRNISVSYMYQNCNDPVTNRTCIFIFRCTTKM